MAGAVPDDFFVEWCPTIPTASEPGTFDWVRITNAIRELACSHGFERDVARVETGTATIVFDNRDRSLDPGNPYAINRGGYTPLRHVRIRATVGATTYTIWRGYTVDWKPGWLMEDGWVVLEAKDSLLTAAAKLRENTLSERISALAPDIWLPLDDGGTAHAQGRGTSGDPASMYSTSSTANLLPFGNQPSTSFPHVGLSRGELVPVVPGSIQVNPTGFTLCAVLKAESPDAQIIFSAGPSPAVDATVPNGDVQLTIDAGDTYSLRVGNAAGASLAQVTRPHADPSTMIVARYQPTSTTLWASQGYPHAGTAPIGGLDILNAGIGGTHAPRAGGVRVGAGMEAANNFPFLGSLSHVALWQTRLSDTSARRLFSAYYGSVANVFDGSRKSHQILNWTLNLLGVPVARRDLAIGTLAMGGTYDDRPALEMMSRCAATEGGYFFANRDGQYVLRLRGATGTHRGAYDTRPSAAPVMSDNDRGLETSAQGWYPGVPGVASAATIVTRSTARSASGVASLAITRQLATVSSAGATLQRSEWSEAHSSLSDGTLGPWLARTTATITNPATAGRDGTNGFLRIQATGAGGCRVDAEMARLPAIPGRPYQAYGFIRAVTVARTARLYWEFFDKDGVLLSTIVGDTVTPTLTAGSWTSFGIGGSFTLGGAPPAGARFRRLGVEIIGPTAAGEAWQVDDVVDGPVGFPCRTGQVIDIAAKVSASVAGKAATAGVAFFGDDHVFAGGGASLGAGSVLDLPDVTPPTVGFGDIAGQITVPVFAVPIRWFMPYVAVTSLAPGETVWFDEINVRPVASGALADMDLTDDDRSFATVARLEVATAADPQIVEVRHANAAIFGDVVYDPPTQFELIADAKAAAVLALGDGTPQLGVVSADVIMGAPGVDPASLLASDILDQVVTVGRIPGPIGWKFNARDSFLGVDPASLGVTASGTPGPYGPLEIVPWSTHGANTWGKDGTGAYRNVVGGGHQQATIPTGAPDHTVEANLSANAGNTMGIVARWESPTNHLLLEWVANTASALLYSVVGGVRTALVGANGVNGDLWGLIVTGTKVTVLRNGAAVGYSTTTLTGTRVGLDAANLTATTSRADNFAATATRLALEPHIELDTIVKVSHHYDQSGSWRTRWATQPT